MYISIVLLTIGQTPPCSLEIYSYARPILWTHSWVVVKRGQEEVCISWFPAAGTAKAFGPPVPGRLRSHKDTMEHARLVQVQVYRWGPYKVDDKLFLLAKAQETRLKSGSVFYKFLDRRLRSISCNCIHAIADIDTTQPVLYTGAAHGIAAGNILYYHFSKWFR